MKVYIDRYTIRIIPEDERDVAFIEDTMRLSKDGDEIALERIDNDNDPLGFRLETDLPSLPEAAKRNAPRPLKEGHYRRPVEDFIDIVDSWDGPPYTRGGAGDTKVDIESDF